MLLQCKTPEIAFKFDKETNLHYFRHHVKKNHYDSSVECHHQSYFFIVISIIYFASWILIVPTMLYYKAKKQYRVDIASLFARYLLILTHRFVAPVSIIYSSIIALFVLALLFAFFIKKYAKQNNLNSEKSTLKKLMNIEVAMHILLILTTATALTIFIIKEYSSEVDAYYQSIVYLNSAYLLFWLISLYHLGKIEL